MNLQANTIRRLAFIKYLYRLGIQQSETPEPLSAVSLLNFHDAIELFLQLASEHLNVGSKETRFMEYWEMLSKKLPVGKELSQKEAVRRLNEARVGLKHHGTLPSKLDIEAFRATTTSFFEENTPIIFNVAFGEISMTDYVQPEQAREHLKTAETLLKSESFAEALDLTAIAFQQMLDDYESRKQDRFHSSPFFFGRDLTHYSSHQIGIGHKRRIGRSLIDGDNDIHEHKYEEKLGKFIDTTKESLEAIQEAIKILAMGVDYRRYTKFKLLTPSVNRTLDGKFDTYRTYEQKHTTADVQYCIEFVIETAVKLQEFDYSLSAR